MLGNTNSAVPSAKEVLENIKTYASSATTELGEFCAEKKNEMETLVTAAQTAAQTASEAEEVVSNSENAARIWAVGTLEEQPLGSAKYYAEQALSALGSFNNGLDGKQDKLTAGENIVIENNVISSVASGSSYTAGEGIEISNNMISTSAPLNQSEAEGSFVVGSFDNVLLDTDQYNTLINVEPTESFTSSKFSTLINSVVYGNVLRSTIINFHLNPGDVTDTIAISTNARFQDSGLENCIYIGIPESDAGVQDNSICIGNSAYSSDYGVTLGHDAYSGIQSLSLGCRAQSEDYSIAIGYDASASNGGIQLGSGYVSDTELQVWNYPLLGGDGIIKNERLDKSTISGYGMPGAQYIDLTLGASGTSYTAPANGWVFFQDTASKGEASLVLRTNYIRVSLTPGSYGNPIMSEIMPVKKGEIFFAEYAYISGENRLLRFVYAEGEN